MFHYIATSGLLADLTQHVAGQDEAEPHCQIVLYHWYTMYTWYMIHVYTKDGTIGTAVSKLHCTLCSVVNLWCDIGNVGQTKAYLPWSWRAMRLTSTH